MRPAVKSLKWTHHPTLTHTHVAHEGYAFVMLHHNGGLRPLIWTIWTHDFPMWTYHSRESAEDGALRLMNMLLLGTKRETPNELRRSEES